jgi:hypothetical protein
MLHRLILGLTLAVSVGTADAHQIWIERQPDGTTQAFFGEYLEELHEKAGGLLDRIPGPVAFLRDRAAPLKLERKEDHFAIAASGNGDVRLIEEGIAPYADKARGGKTKNIFHAKEGRTETAAALDIELVPAAAGSNDLVLMLRGAPVAKAEIAVGGPSLWSKSLHTDDAGRVRLETPWRGRYVVEVVRFEERQGGTGDGAYDRIRHVFTLSFVQDGGLEWKKP